MKAMIIDDEPPARRELRRLLSGFPWVEIVGEAGNIDQAEEVIATTSPELLFLDIQMPGGSGFDLLTRLEDVPQVIFTTAYDEHAVRAFKVDALDYLLKPIEPARLAEALGRARSAQATRTPRPDAVLE
jgi:two-component system, LytTR family, response regulator